MPAGAEQFAPWANLTAVGALIVFLGYLITKGIPNIVQSFAEDLRLQREDFRTELQSQRDHFREDLAAHREQSRLLAETGHESVKQLHRRDTEDEHTRADIRPPE